ncbi:hypothetical protein KIN20_012095 [Parelaphostrongylus tenuis]|uniref:Uncharacterized protein n=1 Tax=Parelaphostrongylus tenuis TaxID=148309 RepID=A0AAD5QK77_PARTN|nr:hypothetical protein KIN20_012095 [Parelaphostrongylus tenuis]
MKKRSLELPTQSCSFPIVYDVMSMRSQLSQQDCGTGTSARVVVVGDGISSVDAIRVCLEHEVPGTTSYAKDGAPNSKFCSVTSFTVVLL